MGRYDSIPEELKSVSQWVCWTEDKMPKNPRTGKNAQSNNSATWADFETACGAVDKFGFSGVGFMFAPPYFGVDLDHCLDNVDFVDEFVETLQSYTEISKSGDGIHIICKGKLPSGARRKNGVEMYSEGRYFIMTGRLYNEKYKTIAECTENIKVLHSKYLHSNIPQIAPRPFEAVNMTDDEIIQKARGCKTGSLFQLLYSGNWQGLYGSQSEADLALCNHLAFWTQKNESQMDRIFRSSGLMRKKWDSRRGGTTYGAATIARAVTDCDSVYEPSSYNGNDSDIALRFFRGVNGENKVKVEAPHKVYEMTDTGNAHRFRDKYAGHVKYSFVRKRWYYWTGKVWEIDNTGEIKKLADEVLKDIKKEAFAEEDQDLRDAMLRWATKSASSHAKEAMIHEAKHLEGIPVLPDEMDAFQDFLNCQNGIVNLKNGELIPHDGQFMMSHITLSEYDTSGDAPELWLKFLEDVTHGDKDLMDYLQKCVGYSLGGSIQEQCAFFLYGLGNNGKSTFLDTIGEMLGTYSSNVQPETIMLKSSLSNSAANSDIARLKSARFVTSEEPTEGVRLNEGLVKQLTGGGKITCRFLYGDEFEYAPEFKLWIATNHKPVIRGTDIGIWRRIRLIPFEVNIPKEKVDKNLRYKLRKELPKILRWAVEGYMKWQKEGLEAPKCVKDATNEYRVEMDVLASFMSSCIEIDYENGERIPANVLFSVYTKWANENNEYVMSSRKFFLEITKKLPEKVRTSSGIVYTKIKLTQYGKGLQKKHNYSIEDFK